MSAHADLGRIAEPSGGAATQEGKFAEGVRWITGALLVGAVATYGLVGVLIYVAVIALV